VKKEGSKLDWKVEEVKGSPYPMIRVNFEGEEITIVKTEGRVEVGVSADVDVVFFKGSHNVSTDYFRTREAQRLEEEVRRYVEGKKYLEERFG